MKRARRGFGFAKFDDTDMMGFAARRVAGLANAAGPSSGIMMRDQTKDNMLPMATPTWGMASRHTAQDGVLPRLNKDGPSRLPEHGAGSRISSSPGGIAEAACAEKTLAEKTRQHEIVRFCYRLHIHAPRPPRQPPPAITRKTRAFDGRRSSLGVRPGCLHVKRPPARIRADDYV